MCNTKITEYIIFLSVHNINKCRYADLTYALFYYTYVDKSIYFVSINFLSQYTPETIVIYHKI